MTPGRIRQSVVADKLQAVERMLAGIGTLPLGSEADFLADGRMVAAGESFLRRGLEGVFDLGRHLLAKGFGEAAAEYKEIAEGLQRHEVVDAATGSTLLKMAGYRNRLVHFYDEVTPGELYTILTRHLGDLGQVLEAFKTWLAAHAEIVDRDL
jgi:uncharacterized protein YutE (UPF0331/DUF86 family)